MKIDPLISIITPTYNRAEYLEETILSILQQDYPNIEYIIVDDGSVDETPTLLKKFSEQSIIIQQNNQGQPRAINRGLKCAHGYWTVVVNSDDPLYTNAISTMVEHLNANHEVIAGYPDWHRIDQKGFIIETIRTPSYRYQDMLRWHHCIPGPCSFIRTDIFKALGGYNPEFPYMPDFEFWLKAGLLGQFMRVPVILATHRVHFSSITVGSQGEEMALEHVRLVKYIYSEFEHPFLSDKKLKKKAQSSAYFEAAYNTIKIHSLRNKFLLQAFQLNPLIIFRIIFKAIIFLKKIINKIFRKRRLLHWKLYLKTTKEKDSSWIY